MAQNSNHLDSGSNRGGFDSLGRSAAGSVDRRLSNQDSEVSNEVESKTGDLSGGGGSGNVVSPDADGQPSGGHGSAGSVALSDDRGRLPAAVSARMADTSAIGTFVAPTVSTVSQGKSDSTDTEGEVIAQKELINSLSVRWTKKASKPPYPKMHCVHPHGGHTLTDTFGWQIMRRAKCQYCQSDNYIRLVAGYVSAKAMKGIEREELETQKGLVRNILRRRAEDVDKRLLDLRCAGCSAVSQGDGV